MFEKGDTVITNIGKVKKVIGFGYNHSESIAILSDGTWEYEGSLKKRTFSIKEIQEFIDRIGIKIKTTKPKMEKLYYGHILLGGTYITNGKEVYATETQLGRLIKEEAEEIAEWTLIFEGQEFKNSQALVDYAVVLMRRRENVD